MARVSNVSESQIKKYLYSGAYLENPFLKTAEDTSQANGSLASYGATKSEIF